MMAELNGVALTCSNCLAPLDGEPEGDVLRCSYCGRAHRFATPPPAPYQHHHPVGSPVLVEWNGRWWHAHVLAAEPSAWRIRYDGWSERWDETVGPDRIRDRPRPDDGPPAPPTTRTHSQPTGCATGLLVLALVAVIASVAVIANLVTSSPEPDLPHVTAETPLTPGQAVSIQWGSGWWPGSVVAVHPNGTVRVHYDGYEANYDEDVPRARLRLR
jgi:hypothetical protein